MNQPGVLCPVRPRVDIAEVDRSACCQRSDDVREPEVQVDGCHALDVQSHICHQLEQGNAQTVSRRSRLLRGLPICPERRTGHIDAQHPRVQAKGQRKSPIALFTWQTSQFCRVPVGVLLDGMDVQVLKHHRAFANGWNGCPEDEVAENGEPHVPRSAVSRTRSAPRNSRVVLVMFPPGGKPDPRIQSGSIASPFDDVNELGARRCTRPSSTTKTAVATPST